MMFMWKFCFVFACIVLLSSEAFCKKKKSSGQRKQLEDDLDNSFDEIMEQKRSEYICDGVNYDF
jgi:hypothetical protein